MQTLTWQQVNSWRIKQQALNPRLPRKKLIQAAIQTGGIQAQVMSAAELAIHARIDNLKRTSIQDALWKNHTLIKTWAMRGTLHLIAADELPLYVAARQAYDNRNWRGYFEYFGFNEQQQEKFLAAIPEILSDQPMTREQLACAVAEHTKIAKLRDLIISSGWGSPLKPSAFRGELCFGPSIGQNVTFVRPNAWTKTSWPKIDPEEALKEVVRRFLTAYGPVTIEGFVRWWWGGAGMNQAKKIFQLLEDELAPVNIEGWNGYILKTSFDKIHKSEPTGVVRLLPLFDAYTLGLSKDIDPILPKIYKKTVFRPQGWVSAVVTIDGFIKGIWEYKTQKSQTIINIKIFSTTSSKSKQKINGELERLESFFNTRLLVNYLA